MGDISKMCPFHLCGHCPFPGGLFHQSGNKIEAVFYLEE